MTGKILLKERNPAPVDIVNIPLLTMFFTSHVVVWPFFPQEYFVQCSSIPTTTCLQPRRSLAKTCHPLFVPALCV